MNESFIAFLGVLIAAGISLAGVVYVQKSTRSLRDSERMSTFESETKRLEAEAYARARESYEAAISRYQAELARMQAHIELSDRMREDQTRRLTRLVEHAEASAKSCTLRIKVLEDELHKHGLPLPEEV